MVDDKGNSSVALELSAALGNVENLTRRVRDLERQLEGQRQLIEDMTPNMAHMQHKKQLLRDRRERGALAFAQDSGQTINPVAFPARIDQSLVRMRPTTADERSARSLEFFERFSLEAGVDDD